MKIGILGAGDMGGRVIRHLANCSYVGAIVAYDIDPKRVEEMRTNHGIDATNDLGKLLSDSSIGLVFVTAANHAHKELTLHALEAGKAVMCEKPMATTLADAREMLDAAKRRNAFLQIGFELRYSRLYTKVKEWIDLGLLGQVVNTHCEYVCSEFWGNKSWRSEGIGGGMFGEKLSHYVDLPRWWINSTVTDVFSVCAPNVVPYYRVRDNYHTTYRFANGAVSHITFSMAPAATFRGDPLQNVVNQQRGDGHELRYFIQGTKGAAATDIYARTIRRWAFGELDGEFTSQLVETLTWEGEEDFTYFHNTKDQARDIVRRVAEGLPPASHAADAYETMRLCFAAEESAETGGIVRLDD